MQNFAVIKLLQLTCPNWMTQHCGNVNGDRVWSIGIDRVVVYVSVNIVFTAPDDLTAASMLLWISCRLHCCVLCGMKTTFYWAFDINALLDDKAKAQKLISVKRAHFSLKWVNCAWIILTKILEHEFFLIVLLEEK